MDFRYYKPYGDKLTEDDIKKIEAAVENELPEDYKTFLLERGGGDVIGLTRLTFAGIDNDILVFFGKDGDLELHPMSRDLRLGHVPSGFPEKSLVIADDMGGNSYFSVFTDEGMEIRWMGYSPNAEHVHVADSFTGFLDMIIVTPYDD